MTAAEDPVARRALLKGLLLAGPALYVGRLGWVEAANALGESGDAAPGAVKEFKLTVGRVPWTLAPGQAFEAYAYNGQIPGPELRVTEGDTVVVEVTNSLAEPTTIHWHGVDVPTDMDGAPQTAQDPIPPGGSFRYRFVARPSGTKWYHSHVDELAQVGGGLAGALIIEPRSGAGAKPDRDYTLMAQAWSLTVLGGHGGGSFDASHGVLTGEVVDTVANGRRPAIHTFNGKAYPDIPPLAVDEGQLVRLRLINASTGSTQTFALSGHTLTLTHTDGNPLAQPVAAKAVRLGVGERADVEFRADNPGRWQLRGFVNGEPGAGPAVDIVYPGHEGAVPVPPTGDEEPVTYAEMAGPPRSAVPVRTYELTLAQGEIGTGAWTINEKTYPETDPIEVREGERVALKLFNMSTQDHPMHMHGHSFQVTAIGDQPVDGPLKDTVVVQHMESYVIELTADNPGRWLFHCHNIHHMMAGMLTELHYL